MIASYPLKIFVNGLRGRIQPTTSLEKTHVTLHVCNQCIENDSYDRSPVILPHVPVLLPVSVKNKKHYQVDLKASCILSAIDNK